MLLLLSAHKEALIRMTRIHLTLSLSIKVMKSQFQSEEVIFDSEVSHA